MNNEFKQISKGDVTRYVLENSSSGGTSSGSVASVSMPLGGTRKRGDNLIAQEADNKTVPTSTPRNFVAKNAKTGGAGAHRDKKKEQKQGVEKHKKPYMEDRDHPDHEIKMASSELMSIAKNAEELLGLVRRYSEQQGLDAWQQSKITKAADYLNSVLQSINGEQQGVAEGQLNEYTPLSGDFGVYMAAALAAGKVGQAAYEWAKQKWKEHQSKNAATVSEKDMDESLGKWARNAALAGAMALGGAGAHAGSWSPMDVPAGGHNQLPDIVAHVKFKVGDKEINKEINLGAHYRSPGEASEELKNFLNSKGIKFYQYSLERVKPKADDKIDSSPATSDMKGSMDTSEPAAAGPSTDNYMAKDNDPERGPSMGGKFTKEDPYFESLQNMLERSVSQAQHNLMVGVAHNPGYAQKVKVKQEVGQEFAQADVGHDISKLPIRVPKKK
jgi:hypothetical protein